MKKKIIALIMIIPIVFLIALFSVGKAAGVSTRPSLSGSSPTAASISRTAASILFLSIISPRLHENKFDDTVGVVGDIINLRC